MKSLDKASELARKAGVRVTVKFLPATDEYVVRLFVRGIRDAARDYYAADVDDATATADRIIAEEVGRYLRRPPLFREPLLKVAP